MPSNYFEEYSEKLTNHLVSACTKEGYLSGKLLNSPDIDSKWDEMAPEYFADSIKEFNAYPTFVLAVAGYLGMGVAHMWDKDWAVGSACGYEAYHDERGFDYMDEFMVPEVLGLTGPDADYVNEAMHFCSSNALSYLRHETVEPGSVTAYKLVLATIAVLFRLGEAIELHRLGYSLEKVNLS